MVNWFTANGPDGGMFGAGNAETLYLVSRHQPAYIDEKTRQIARHDSLEITVRCSAR
jgi:hypothetical protein